MQQRILVRAPTLAAFRRALSERATSGSWLDARSRAVLVPTRAAGELLRQTIEQHAADEGRAGIVCPEFVTRDGLLVRLHGALPDGRRYLDRLEREVIFESAAHEVLARRQFGRPPFRLRPGLVSAMLDFYDELGRRQRTVRRLARVIFDELRVERGTDRGSENLIDQARFLAFTFLGYRRAVDRVGGIDEHGLRRALIERQPALPFTELLVAVADHPADPRGLWPSDFDLVGRLTGLERLVVVMTDEAHDAGFRERLEEELPGIGEARAAAVGQLPSLETSPRAPGRPPVFISRDREDELRDVARLIRSRANDEGRLPGPVAVVFHRPLPYLYLAQQVLTDAGIPYQAFDALPLAAEPFAALVDLYLAVVRTRGAAESVAALAQSPIFAASLWEPARRPAELPDAIRASAGEFRSASTPASQVRALIQFLRTHALSAGAADSTGRLERVRADVLGVLESLASALDQSNEPARSPEELAAWIHHAIEARTFAPERSGRAGVLLVDAVAARFGEFDQVFLVGLVETDWTERPRRNVFFPASLLAALGWPADRARVEAQRAAFRDVLGLARKQARLSAFELDGDTLVGLSTMIGAAAALPVVETADPARTPLFADERLGEPIGGDSPGAGIWLSARRRRPELSTPAYAGTVAPRPSGVYRVSRVDRYVTCPFKYFAEDVLGLAERRRPSAGLDPLERGTLLHELFETFYEKWQRAGYGAITAENLSDAEQLFMGIAEEAIARLPEADQALERLRLVGSIVAPGMADRVFDLEVAAGRPVAKRLIEVDLRGSFTFPILHGLSERAIEIRGKADRVDVLEDGSIRVVDYKLGRMPDLNASIQIGVYAHCARQALEKSDGRSHPVSSATYLAFGDERRLEGKLPGRAAEVDYAVAAKASAFAAAVDRIESGDFPPRPLRPSECSWCGFTAVCRKEYRIEETDEAAEPV